MSNMSEKLPLIPVALSANKCPRVNRGSKGLSTRKFLTAAAAAAGIIYYGVPYGMFGNR
jgi:hypothetical protein